MQLPEVLRRVRALIDMAPRERPVSTDRLEQLAGLGDGELYVIAKRGTMLERTRKRLARALGWVENDQVVVRRRANKPSEITIRDPQPPQENLFRVQMDAKRGVRVELHAVNPRTFPHRRK